MADNKVNPLNVRPPSFDSSLLNATNLNPNATNVSSQSFKDLISKAIDEVNRLQADADIAMKEFVKTGSLEKLPEVITKIKQAEIAFDLLVQIRNKVIDAYNDIQRMPL